MARTANQTIARTIISQLGGFGRLRCMVNARDIVADTNAVWFRFSGSHKFNKCKVTLDASDTYTVEFYKFSPKKMTCDLKDSTSGVYCDQLISLFESTTGLYLSL